ncbi:amidohydrolase [bacterium AH-315-J21]|nr:amidohydrolase [bacterium AH-315-J21]
MALESIKGTVLYNGAIETMAANIRACDSLALQNGAILAVGKNLEHDTDFTSFQKIDLHGATVYPGFVDAHTHFHYFALSLGKAQLAGERTLKSALNKLSAHARNLRPKEWLLGEGLFIAETSQENWNAAAALDTITGARPAAIYTRDQHTLWANTAALSRANIGQSTPNPSGGKIERFSNGAPSGILRENSAIALILDQVPEITKSRTNELYQQALQIAYSRGVTGVHSFDSWRGFDFFHTLAQKKQLGLRISYYLQPPDLHKAEKLLGESLYFGLKRGWLRIAGMKIFSDGALGSRTALTHQPYLKSNGNQGLEVTSPKELRRLIKIAAEHSLPCAIHAIGDKAVTNCIEALSKVPPDKISTKARHRIEHLQMIRRQDIPALKDSGIVASMQPSHLPDDVADIESCWGARAKNCYVFRSLLKSNIPLAFGSDVPIVELNPLAGIRDAVRRRSSNGRSILNTAEKISAHQAAFCFTRGAAYSSGEEDYSGSILPGYRADLTVISQSLRHVNMTSVADVEILATIIDGKVVYSTSGFEL